MAFPAWMLDTWTPLGGVLAAYELGTFGPPASTTVPYLIQALQGPNAGNL